MQGSCRHSLHFSFFCFLFLPPTPDFLSLLFLSFSHPFCFLPCFSLLSFVSLYPHLSLSASLLLSLSSISVTSLGLSPRAPRYLGLRRRRPEEGPRSRLPSSSQAIAGCRLKCPQDSSIEAFPHHPDRALCVPSFPGISRRRPRNTMPHIVSPILWGGSSNSSPSNSSNSYPRGFPRFQLPSPDFSLGELPASHTLSTTPASSPGSWAGSGCSRYAPYCL